jgi:hypothetical protein
VLSALQAAGESMPNDPLPVPDIIAEPRREAAGDMVRAQISATERQRSLITEYINRNRRPDTEKLVGPIARREAATQNAELAPSDPAHRLRALAGTIRQIEVALPTNHMSAPDVHFAVERIQDVAFALRQRGIEPVLCDALETAIREVGDAVVRQDAAAARAAGAEAQLHELAREVGDLIETFADQDTARAAMAPPAIEPVEPDFVVAHAATATLSSSSVEQPPLPARAATPSGEAESLPGSTPLSALPLPSPLDGGGNPGVARSSSGADSALFLDSAAVFAAAATDSATAESPPLRARANLINNDLSPPAATNERAPHGDTSANLFALSDEELIALFS